LVHPGSRRRRAVDPLFEIKLELKPRGSRETSRTLHHELRGAILDGRLAAGARLPATRKSAAFFGVSRNTAAEVYERLVTEGHAVTRHGAGTYVTERPVSPASASPIESASSKRFLATGRYHRGDEFLAGLA
jgi:GntR family transcriptional regulator / MocR family aminotransferase